MCNSQNIEKRKIICVDLETTGLNPFDDEILQLSIINGNNEILFNEYIKPKNKTSWVAAEKIHGISPEDVKDLPTISKHINELNMIFENAEIIIGYNLISFDRYFLIEVGINIPDDIEYYDVMFEFAPIYGECNDYFGDYKWQSLYTCSKYYDYDWSNENLYNSLSKAKATLHCFNKMTQSLL